MNDFDEFTYGDLFKIALLGFIIGLCGGAMLHKAFGHSPPQTIHVTIELTPKTYPEAIP